MDSLQLGAGVVTRYLVALRRGDGKVEPCPEPIGTTGVFALLRRLAPYQELRVSVVPDGALPCGCKRTHLKEEGSSSGANTAGAEPESPSRVQTEQEHS